MNIERKYNYYTLLSPHVRYNDKLKPFAKLLYAEIEFLQRKYGNCFISNQTICKLFKVSEANVTRSIGALIKEKLIRIELNSYRDSRGQIKSERKIYLIQNKDEQGKNENSSSNKNDERPNSISSADKKHSIFPPIKNDDRPVDRQSINDITAHQNNELADPQKDEHNVTREKNNTSILLQEETLSNINREQNLLFRVLTKPVIRRHAEECDSTFEEKLNRAIDNLIHEFDPNGIGAAELIKAIENNPKSIFNIRYQKLVNEIYKSCKLS